MDSAEKEDLIKKVQESSEKVDVNGQDEIDKLRDQIIVAIKKDEFKKEILEELNARGWKASFWKTAQHPAVLLILGFAFTTVLGSLLSYVWQNRANEKQQERTQRQHDFEQKQTLQQRTVQQKNELADQVVRAVAETNTSAEDILTAFQWDHKDQREFPERIKYWQDGSRKWRIESKILRPKIISSFRDGEVSVIFNYIIDDRTVIGNCIENVQEAIGEEGWKQMQEDKALATCRKESKRLINQIKNNVSLLMNTMVEEIKNDEKPISTPSTPAESKSTQWGWPFW